MLGAAPYMPADAQVVQGPDDLQRMFPTDLQVLLLLLLPSPLFLALLVPRVFV